VSYRELVQAVIDENRRVLEAVPEADVQRLIGEIERAKTIVMLLIEKRGVSMAEMQRRHTNLEGVMGEFA
jgi:hypothetical protein